MKIEYKGKDITKEVSINECVHDMYAEKRSDTLRLRLNDVEGVWDSWAPELGDTIVVSHESISTGLMYVHRCTALNGVYSIKASALPVSWKNKNNKAWQKVRLLQIGQEVAKRHGLKFKQYGVSDQLYNYILQENQDDFAFLSERCTLEGCAMLVCDNTLVIYNQAYMERQKVDEFLDLSIDATFDYRDRRAQSYGACEVECGAYRGKFSHGSGAVLRPTKQIYVGNNAEAERFAKNLLRDANKDRETGTIKGDVLSAYAAGSSAVIKNAKAAHWNGPVFLTHVRNDYGNLTNKLFFRKPLEGY